MLTPNAASAPLQLNVGKLFEYQSPVTGWVGEVRAEIVGTVVSIFTVTLLAASTLPAASVER